MANFWQKVGRTLTGVGEAIAPLGRTLGEALYSPFAVKQMEEQTARQMQETQKYMKAYQETTDPKKKETYRKVLQTISKQPGYDIETVIPSIKKTPLQIAGEAGVTAVSALSGGAFGGARAGAAVAAPKVAKAVSPAAKIFQPISKAKTALDVMGKVPTATRAQKVAGTVWRAGVKPAATGAAFGVADAVSRGEKNVGKEAAAMAAINVVVPPVAGKALQVAGRGFKKVYNVAKANTGKALEKLEKYSAEPSAKNANWLMQVSQGTTAAELPKRAAAKVVKVAKAISPERVYTAWVDKFAPIQRVVKAAEAKLQKKVSGTPADAYMKARLYGGIQGRYKVAENDYLNILDKYKA